MTSPSKDPADYDPIDRWGNPIEAEACVDCEKPLTRDELEDYDPMKICYECAERRDEAIQNSFVSRLIDYDDDTHRPWMTTSGDYWRD